jgi:hypothetical protein
VVAGGGVSRVTRERRLEGHGGKADQRVRLPNMKFKPTEDRAWTEQHDLVIQIASPEVAAEKLGRTIEAVLGRRKELGLPDPLSSRERQVRQRKE